MLSKEEFVKYMEILKNTYNYYESIYAASQGSIDILENEDVSNILQAYVEMLEKFMEVEPIFEIGSEIQYFIYELDFGNDDRAPEAIKYQNGEVIDLSSIDKFYDYLM